MSTNMTTLDSVVRKVAFLGPEYSYTHQATLKDFPETQGFDHLPCHGIQEVFEAVRSGSVSFGVVPIENSTNGLVNLTINLLVANKQQLQGGLGVCGEAYVGIHHYLLGFHRDSLSEHNKSEANRLEEDLKDIEVIYSHSQVWSQCGKFLSTHLNHTLHHSVSSTAEAAHLVANLKSRSCAAISSLSAGQACQLDVLAEKIEDREDNQTRFLVLHRFGDAGPADLPDCFRSSHGDEIWKLLVNFTIDAEAGINLSHALGVFGSYGLKVININSLPSGQQPWHYTYFVEIEGHEQDPKVQKALASLKHLSVHYKCYGNIKDRRKE